MKPGTFMALDEAIAAASVPERAALVIGLSARLAQLGAAMQTVPEEQLITVEEAGDLACAPARRVRSWSRGKPWVRHLSRRTMRIEKNGFVEWLRCSQRSPTLPEAQPEAANVCATVAGGRAAHVRRA